MFDVYFYIQSLHVLTLGTSWKTTRGWAVEDFPAERLLALSCQSTAAMRNAHSVVWGSSTKSVQSSFIPLWKMKSWARRSGTNAEFKCSCWTRTTDVSTHPLFSGTTVCQKRLMSAKGRGVKSERLIRKKELFNHLPLAFITFCCHPDAALKLYFSPSSHLTPRRSLSSAERRTQKHFARSVESLDLSQWLLDSSGEWQPQRNKDGVMVWLTAFYVCSLQGQMYPK